MMSMERLTATERRVVELVCEGLTNPQIAQRLSVSPRTVQGHLLKVFRKYRVSSRTELVVRLLRSAEGTPSDVKRGEPGGIGQGNAPSGAQARGHRPQNLPTDNGAPADTRRGSAPEAEGL